MSTSNSSGIGSQEHTRSAANGWIMLAINLAMMIGGILLLLRGIRGHQARFVGELHGFTDNPTLLLWLGIGLLVLGGISLGGHFALQPNEARVLILAGAYHGTVRHSGFF